MYNIGKYNYDKGERFLFIGGPCVIESEEHAFFMAREIKNITDRLNLKFVFKASFDKANRSSIKSFRGCGIEEGIKILKKIRDELSVPITTDFHTVEQVEQFGKEVDIIQIPAFLCRQTDLLVASAKTGKVVNVKKGQFVAPDQMKFVIEKIISEGNKNVIITERGYSFGYGDLIVDMRNFELWRNEMALVCYDTTHSVQRPGGGSGVSGGDRNFISPLARSAVANGIDALFMEVHDNPEQALSDSATQFPLSKLEVLLKTLIIIDDLVKSN